MDNSAGLRVDGMRTLVTGASGFLGARLCLDLQRRGAEVYAVSRRSREQSGIDYDGAWLQTDLLDLETVRRMLCEIQPELILHFSGHVTATPELAVVDSTFGSLLGSSVNVLQAATEVGCAQRIILPGSTMEPETNARVPLHSPYLAAKVATSVYARMFHALYQTPVVLLRLSVTYGPGQPDNRLLPYVIRSLHAGRAPELTSGRFEADWTYIDDMIRGVLAVAEAPGVVGETIDLGTGTVATVREVVEHVVDLMQSSVQPVFGARPDRPDDPALPATIEFARDHVGWTATTSLREGLRRTIAWFTGEGVAGHRLPAAVLGLAPEKARVER